MLDKISLRISKPRTLWIWTMIHKNSIRWPKVLWMLLLARFNEWIEAMVALTSSLGSYTNVLPSTYLMCCSTYKAFLYMVYLCFTQYIFNVLLYIQGHFCTWCTYVLILAKGLISMVSEQE
jgi:hypothetical protein